MILRLLVHQKSKIWCGTAHSVIIYKLDVSCHYVSVQNVELTFTLRLVLL